MVKISTLLKPFVQETRTLTEGEVALCREVFKETIDYDAVRLLKTRRTFSDGLAPDSNIFMRPNVYSEDFSHKGVALQAFFIHEMTHVWQAQNGRSPVKGVLSIMMNLKSYDWSYDKAYAFPVPEGDALAAADQSYFEGLNIEQQAHLIDRAFYCNRLAGYFRSQSYPDEYGQQIIGWDDYYTDLCSRVLPEALLYSELDAV